jgi:hypothetical protein
MVVIGIYGCCSFSLYGDVTMRQLKVHSTTVKRNLDQHTAPSGYPYPTRTAWTRMKKKTRAFMHVVTADLLPWPRLKSRLQTKSAYEVSRSKDGKECFGLDETGAIDSKLCNTWKTPGAARRGLPACRRLRHC